MGRVLKGTKRVALFAQVIMALGISVALAQLPTGTILGVVKDSGGAVIPNSSVTVRSTETGLTRTQKTAANGTYRVDALPAGAYEIKAEQMGFQTEVRNNVSLSVGQQAVIDFALQIGSVTQSVEVTGEAPLVNTTNGSVGSLVNEQQVQDLPLNGRNFMDLTLLQPGVTQLRQSNNVAPLTNAGTRFSNNGAPLRSNTFLLDGSPLANPYDGTYASVGSTTLGIEGIREWQVITSSTSAEYGMRMGAQMTMVSKSGTNSFHGSAYEYLRNSSLDARNFFDYPSPASKAGFRLPEYQRNQYGGSAGGPIKKDKLFVFGTYEDLTERLGTTNIVNVPAAGCHGGAGTVITNTACSQLGAATASATISPVTAPLLALFPVPNLSGNRFTYPFKSPTDEHYGQIRGDYNISSKNSLFVRYTVDQANVEQTVQNPYPEYTRVGVSRNDFVTLSESHTFGAAMVGTFRWAFGQPTTVVDTSYAANAVGPQFGFAPGQNMGTLNVGSGVTAIGPDSLTPGQANHFVYTYSGDIFYTKGRHSFKFGTLINHYHPTTINGAGLRGSLTFPNFNSFLLAQTMSYSSREPGDNDIKDYTFDTIGVYVQDDFRARPNFTLNVGLRYEINTRYVETSGRFSALVNPLTDPQYTVGPISQNPSLRNISPRLGLAWDVKGDGKTAVRAGFGILYDVGALGTYINANSMQSPPFSVNDSFSSLTAITLTGLPLTYPTNVAIQSVGTLDYHLRNPHMLSYNLTMERQLPFTMSLSVGYVGTRGLDLLYGTGTNALVPAVLSTGQFFWTGLGSRPNPNFSGVSLTSAAYNSYYNSLQATLKKQLSKGLQFQGSFSWTKAIDSCNGSASADGSCSSARTFQLPETVDRSLSDFNVTASWRFNTIYHIPVMSGLTGFRGALLNGWWTSAVLTLLSGSPFTVTTGGTDESRSLGAGNRPDMNQGRNNGNITSGVTAGCPGVAAGQQLGTPNLYFDPCAYSLEPLGFLGTVGRNTLIGPGDENLDFSLVKDTSVRRLGEGGNLEFRAEIFNILNHANFFKPSSGVFSAPSTTVVSTAGQITSTGFQTSRQIQFAMKLIW